MIVDLFTGSGNLLYHLSQETRAVKSMGFEINKSIYNCTKNNMEKLELEDCKIMNDNFEN